MKRPVYEKDSDRKREEEVARRITEKWQARVIMLPQFAVADMLIIDNKDNPRCWAEVKSRNMNFGQYRHMHIAADKIERLQDLMRLTKLKAIIICALYDGIYWHPCPETREQIVREMGGRTDRNDPADIHEMACLHWHNFKRIG